jgi:hypothetical protein
MLIKIEDSKKGLVNLVIYPRGRPGAWKPWGSWDPMVAQEPLAL